MNGGLTRCADPPIRLVRPSRKQNFECFCNFFAIRDSLLSVQSGNGPFRGRFAAFSGLNLLFGVPRQSLIAKKVAILVAILFLVLGLLRNDAQAG